MKPRMNYGASASEVMQAMLALEEATHKMTISPQLRELVKMRVSQINGCAYCLHMHAPDARKSGVSQEKLDVLAAWRESPAFDARERAALRWAESLTRDRGHGRSRRGL
ncbi:carboxymuconolactone decarboxylase family protein [Devosia algicola]|uniref:carboxymuconolactone decarboxylase family protein n=1 Tax=Devosia algicola TaxID=3026418 RepID=UPI002E1E1A8B